MDSYTDKLRHGLATSLARRGSLAIIIEEAQKAQKNAREAMPLVVKKSRLVEKTMGRIEPAVQQLVAHFDLIRREKTRPRYENAAKLQDKFRSQLAEVEVSFKDDSEVADLHLKIDELRDQVSDLQKHRDLLQGKVSQYQEKVKETRLIESIRRTKLLGILRENMKLAEEFPAPHSDFTVKATFQRRPATQSYRLSGNFDPSTRAKKRKIKELKISAQRLSYGLSSKFLRVRDWEGMYESCVEACERYISNSKKWTYRPGIPTPQYEDLTRLFEKWGGKEALQQQTFPKTTRSTTAATTSRSIHSSRSTFSPRNRLL